MIKFCQREATDLWLNQDERDRCRLVGTNLGVTGVRVEYVAEKLAGDGNASDDESMDIVRIYNESTVCSVGSELGHAVEIDEETEEDLVCGWTVFKDAEEISLKRYCRDVACVESKGCGGRGKGGTGSGGERAPDCIVDERRCGWWRSGGRGCR